MFFVDNTFVFKQFPRRRGARRCRSLPLEIPQRRAPAEGESTETGESLESMEAEGFTRAYQDRKDSRECIVVTRGIDSIRCWCFCCFLFVAGQFVFFVILLPWIWISCDCSNCMCLYSTGADGVSRTQRPMHSQAHFVVCDGSVVIPFREGFVRRALSQPSSVGSWPTP